MPRSRSGAACLLAIALFSVAGRAAAQTGTSAPATPLATPPPAAPVPAPAPEPEVQRFEPADVDAPKAAPPAPRATKIEPAARPLAMDEMAVATAGNRVTLNFFGDPAFAIDSQHETSPGFVLNPLNFLVTGRSGNLIAMTEFALEQI